MKRSWAISPLATTPAFWLGAACLVLHLVANNQYDVFRDELYFIVCGQHPAFGYVDQPPLIPLIAAASYSMFGTALLPLRFLPALAMAATVALTAEFARSLGGGRFAQTLSGLATLLAPVFLVYGLLLVTDMLQPLTWLACSWLLAYLIRTRDERAWLAFGAVVGVSLASKYLILFYLAGLALGVVATPLRRSLLKPWLYGGAALALAMVAPNLWWQAAHGWPFIELGKAGASGKNIALSPVAYMLQEMLLVGPATAPLWIAGLWRLITDKSAPGLRAIPIAYVAMAALFVVIHGKAYYLAPIYPTLFAAGGVAFEGWLGRPAWRWIAVVVVASGVGALPMALPVLPPPQLGAYSRAIGLSPSHTAFERGAQSPLPQYFADMFGWREMAAKVSAVYQSLPPADRERAVFFGRNYGEAAALDIYGPALGGPPAISGHNNYFLWGPRGFDGSVVITVGADVATVAKEFGDIEVAGHLDDPYAMPFETNINIYVLRSPRRPLAEIWPMLKHFD
jgi:Dolichyl-phosphate-mannose-protein mannosyltransferase